ncbi:hypothetical protein [Chryseobacterium sp. 5_R23647]|uniref:hypothetical protein n=1 Tax=Chryseobacterium sp. 5_R23647 TaxID=2258964 RepID=UPI000E242C2B|nr:hypothetical protein [Chryseobacterium sp. 5_R23647]REC40933.1 hypothetical protein DRF69_16895 [Chryseobacterium sp. 5_R23647]
MKTSYKKDFTDWMKKGNVQVLKELKNSDFKIGDIVTFTNEYGIQFENIEILGFTNDESLQERIVYLDFSCYWFPVKLSEIKK